MFVSETATTRAPDEASIRGALLGVIDPELGDNIVDLGMVRAINIGPDARVEVVIALTTAGCPMRAQIKADTVVRVGSLPGVRGVEVTYGEMTKPEKAKLMDRARFKAQEGAPVTDIPATCRILAIASGKGGVGKSSVTANLAAALAERGKVVGVLDADIWGFSIPRMLGLEGEIEAEGDKEAWRMVPLERHIANPNGPDGLVRVVSMGFMAQEQEAIMWRGLMLNRALQHFIENVAWTGGPSSAAPGQLDYLLIDMPPGTGDIQMGLARMLPRSEMLIVTTPALAAQKVASRAADMARKGHLRVAGVIENMTAFVCDHGTSYPLFGAGGGERLAHDIGVPLVAQIPMEPGVALGGDTGSPISLEAAGSPATDAFRSLAADVVTTIAPLIEVQDCTVRMLAAMEAAFPVKEPARPGVAG